MKGSPTPIEIKEEAKALVAQTGNKTLVAKMLGIPRETIRDIVLNDDEFAEFRQQVQKEYILKTWGNILEIETALAKKIAEGKADRMGITELTRVLKDLKATVENVVNNINNGVVNNYYSPEIIREKFTELELSDPDTERYIYEKLKSKFEPSI